MQVCRQYLKRRHDRWFEDQWCRQEEFILELCTSYCEALYIDGCNSLFSLRMKYRHRFILYLEVKTMLWHQKDIDKEGLGALHNTRYSIEGNF
jgi:hypothetical protein